MKRLIAAAIAAIALLPSVAAAQTTIMPGRNWIYRLDGNAAAPSNSYDGDRDTGSYRIGANNEGFSAGGTLRWDYNTTRMNLSSSYILAWNDDVNLIRSGIDQLALRRSTNTQTLSVGPAASDLYFEKGNGGAAYVLARDNVQLNLGQNNTVRWSINTSSHLVPNVDNTQNIGAAGARVAIGFFGAVTLGGGNAASTGAVRLPNNNAVYWRNAGNTTEYGFYLDTSDRLVAGPGATLLAQWGNGASFLAGADSGSSGLTNTTTKIGRVGTPHYTNAEEPVAAWTIQSGAAASDLYIGGGTGVFNAVTTIHFYTAANTTTTTGTERWQIDSSGNLSALSNYNVTTTGVISVGSSPANASGLIRAGNSTAVVVARNGANSGDRTLLGIDGSDSTYIGSGGGLKVLPGSAGMHLGDATSYWASISLGSGTATTGLLRVNHGATFQGRNNAGAANVQLLDWGNTATDVLTVGSSGMSQLSLLATDIKWGKALVALGGGAAPTLGTIGGSGPATAAQNSWMRIIDSTGAAFWVPAWK